jgi:D-glycero-alpha-D-manno-heptose 1-phosphate guanylyltransferase
VADGSFAAAILAGGQGARIKDIANGLPKCLLPIDGRPFLGLLVHKLLHEGCDEIALILGYGERLVQKYISIELKDIPIRSNICRAGTGRAVFTALQLLSHRHDVMCLNGDTVIDVNYGAVMKFHRNLKPTATIVTTDLRGVPNEGAVSVSADGRVWAFTEGKALRLTGSPRPNNRRVSNCGIYCLRTSVTGLAAFAAGSDFEQNVLPALVSSEVIMSVSNGTNLFADFGTPDRYLRLNTQISELRRLYPIGSEA